MGEDLSNTERLVRENEELRRTKRDLGAALARHEALLAALPDIVMEVDANKVYVWANQPGIGFFGSDVVGKEAAFYFEGEQDTYERVRPLFHGDEETFYVESWQRRADGEKRLLAWWCRALKDDAGNVTGALSTGRDVTEERSAAIEIFEAEQRFRSFFDNAPIGKSMTGPDGTLLRVNAALCSMLGYSADELQSMTFVPITHPDDVAESVENLRALFAGERDEWATEKRYIAKDGRLVWAHVTTSLQRGSDGKPLYLLTHVLDITERKQADTKLRESEALYRSLFENMMNGFAHCRMLFDQGRPVDFIYLNVNHAFETQTGLKNVVGRKVSEVVPGIRESDPGLFEIYGRVAATGTPEVFEMYVQSLAMWFAISVYSPSREHFVAVFDVITERKRAEHDLEASETRYRRLFEAAQDGILILDADTGKIVDVNPFLVALTGYSHEEFLGKHLWEVGPLRDIAASKVSFAELQAEKYVRYDDLPLRTRDGRKIDVEFVSNVYRVDNQRVIQCNVRDISERKRNEREMESLSRFPSENPSPVLRLELDGTLLYANQAASPLLRHWGIEPGQRAPTNLTAVIGDAMATGERREHEMACAGRTYSLHIQPIRTAGYVNVYGNDVTERKRADDALRRAEGRLRRFYESGLLGVVFWNTRGQITDANDKFLRMVGYTRDDLAAGRIDWVNMTPPEHRHVDDESVAELKATGVNKRPFEKEYVRKDGTRIPIAVAGAMLDEERVNGVAFVLDITERKRAEAERERLQEQLLASQKMEAIGGLAGGIAHDFNNLLSVILSYANFALEAVREDDPLHDDLLAINGAAERAARLTAQLLAFGRKQVLRPEPLDLNRVVSEMDNMLRRIIGEDIDLLQMPARGLGVALADPSQVEQVIMNLAVNARDAMPQGGRLTIETANVDLDEGYAAAHVDVKPGHYVMLAVTDTGCGMDERTRARIFEPFFTTKGPTKGTGLGLSTVYGIVKQSGGNITVYSEPGRGTTFKVYLPREVDVVAASAGPPLSTAPAVGTETILVVEDEPALGAVAKRILGAAGYTVLVAQNGGQALLMCEGHEGQIHLVLTDVVMPQMSGKAFAERVAKVRPGIKVLYMSGYTDNAIVHHGVLDPGTNFIAKPFNAADLARKVREVLDAGGDR